MPVHVFNDLEGIRIATEMELRGEAFYRRAAQMSKSPEAVELLNALADDELYHMQEFGRLYERECDHYRGVGAPSSHYDDETNVYLGAIAADIVFPGGLMALRKEGFDSPAAIFRQAIDSEKDSILFYTELAAKAGSERAARIFREIIKQERGHMLRLQMMLAQLAEETG